MKRIAIIAALVFAAVTAGAQVVNPPAGGGGSGTVTEVDTTSPISGGPVTTTGTLTCPTCVVSTSPGAGLAHFAGSTQTVTSSAVNLTAAADVTGTLPAANVVTGTSGAAIPLLSTANTWTLGQTFSALVTASAGVTMAAGQSYAIGTVFKMGNAGTTFQMGNAEWVSISSTTSVAGANDIGYDRAGPGILEANLGTARGNGGSFEGASFISAGTKFTATGCTSISSTVGGATAGQFVIGGNTCTVVITINGATGLTAPNGWACGASDETTAAGNTGLYFSAHSATTATLTVPATAAASDVIVFRCTGY